MQMWAVVITDKLRTDGFCKHLPAEKSFLPATRAKHCTRCSLKYISSLFNSQMIILFVVIPSICTL